MTTARASASVIGIAAKTRTIASSKQKKVRRSSVVSRLRRTKASKENRSDEDPAMHYSSGNNGGAEPRASLGRDVRKRENHHSRRCRESIPIHEPALVAPRGREGQERQGHHMGLRSRRSEHLATRRHPAQRFRGRYEAEDYRSSHEGRLSSSCLGRSHSSGRQALRSS